MYELSVRARFAAAHFLRDYSGPCAQLHGHTWTVEVAVKGKEIGQNGMLIDFQELKSALKKITGELDHRNLNDLKFFGESGVNPTAENLARHIFLRLKNELTFTEGGVDVSLVRVWESPDAWASYREDGI
ncbi:MAG: 6-carboxytetrahydropterin synthase QueD [Eubacteriales bacterium]